MESGGGRKRSGKSSVHKATPSAVRVACDMAADVQPVDVASERVREELEICRGSAKEVMSGPL